MSISRRARRDAKVVVGGGAYDDAVQITRALQVRGAGVWQVGVEFLWTSQPGSWSLRRMVSRLRRDRPAGRRHGVLDRRSQLGGTGVKSLIREERAGSRRIRAPAGVHRSGLHPRDAAAGHSDQRDYLSVNLSLAAASS